MSFPWFLTFQPRFAPEDDPAAGGAGGGGGAPAGGDAGGGEGGSGDTEPTLGDVFKELQAQRKDFDQYRHTTNKELQRLRKGDKPDRGGEDGKDDKGDKGNPDHVTRDELRAERRYNRGLGRLEALGLDDDALAEVEEHCEDLSPAERARYVEAFALGLERGSSKPGSRPEDGRRRRTPNGKGGEPPPAPKGSDVPESWDEYMALRKSDPDRAKKLVHSGEINLVELREAKNAR